MKGRFYLDRVLDPDFNVPHGPELEQVAYLSITLIPMAHSQMVTLNFLADIPLTTAELHWRIREHTPLAYLTVHHLVLEFRFAGDELPCSQRTMCCELTTPNQHNLTDTPEHQQILQYLHRWGLYDGNPNAGCTRFATTK